ncbi:hypothetical protein [Thermococcus sp.]|uniref:hypothetical protein n=1 Tax=Thermococcus sp. TaxID=35749 RepID=UPI002638B5C6|nr:hypothetical protein [Thermococcus sp.]
MDKTNALVLVLILLGALIGGCISTPGTTQTQMHGAGNISTPSSSGTQTGETSSFTSAVGTAEINGTFSGWLTAPMAYFDEIERFLNSTNVTLYAFTAEVEGNMNASITVYVLKLVPAFVPKDVNVSINGREIKGATCVAYSDPLPVSISRKEGNGLVGTTAYLKVHPLGNVTFTTRVSASELNNVTERTLLQTREMKFVVRVVKPNDYVFTVLCNGTNVSSGRLTLG